MFFLSVSKMEPKFDILSELANNPGLKHIGEKICLLLDLKTLFSCRRVQHSWNEFLNDPRFWLKRLSKTRLIWKGKLTNDDVKKQWTKLVEIVEKTKLYENISLYLMKMDCPDYRLRWCALPLHVASSEGDLALVRIILQHFDEKIIYDLMNEYDEHHDPIHGYTPLHMAAFGGM